MNSLQTYRVLIKDGAQVRLSFEAMSASRTDAQRQHEVLCEPGEQCIVHTTSEWESIRFRPRRLTAIEFQRRQDDVNRVIEGAA